MRPIYLFPHIPKTGGAAFITNGDISLPPSQRLRLNHTYRQFYYDPRTGALCFYEKEEDLNHLIQSLTQEEKEKIRFINGHDLCYGLHKQFPQEARYFLFVRDPIARTISLYNYHRYQRDFLLKMEKMDEVHKRIAILSDQIFLIDGQVPSFEEWLEKSYDAGHPFYFSMSRFLQNYGYLDPDGCLDQMFEKFYFIGITETMKDDELYLYHKIGIRRFWADRNCSKPYVVYEKLSTQIQERIREKNQKDFALYERAKMVNLRFKTQAQHQFKSTLKRMEWMKRKSFFFEKSIPPIKNILRPIVRKMRKVLFKPQGDYERFTPQIPDIPTALEHYRRYTFAAPFVKNLSVLDLACGEGFGSSILAAHASEVVGMDCCVRTIIQAKKKYTQENLSFLVGSMIQFPFARERKFDVIVCFEALEHIVDQRACLKEMKNHLKKEGMLILSTPNRPVYSRNGAHKNPYHLKELDFRELNSLLSSCFSHVKIYGQKTIHFSHIFPMDCSSNPFMDFAMRDPNPPYFVCLASDHLVNDSPGRFYFSDSRFPDHLPFANTNIVLPPERPLDEN
jgi:2-polyprenyl-3-methyl-5-hydroxy-6-metoxy-1,4-benzoquinol methylase